MYGFLRTPKWILGHVLVVVTVVGFVTLGFWQLRRLDEVRTANAVVSERLAHAEQPLADVLASGPADQIAYRPVRAEGTYQIGAEMVTVPRSQDGRPGHHVLTPLDVGGRAVLVDRGWIPFNGSRPALEQGSPPPGEVVVRGVLMPPEPGGPAGNRELVERIVPADLSERAAIELAPVYLRLTAQQPAQSTGLPVPAAGPTLDEGNHLSYAIQWFLFATVVAVGYPLLIRRTGREGRAGAGSSASERRPEEAVTR